MDTPLQPGASLYPLQTVAETWRFSLTRDPARQADLALTYAELRLTDLALASNENLSLAAQAFDEALTLTSETLAVAPRRPNPNCWQNLTKCMCKQSP
ncbi:MAG: hypothetical protein H6636_06030 [Anaerolineales bacterium]|nr:hypothetical protein [Anaerolineales bacterium]